MASLSAYPCLSPFPQTSTAKTKPPSHYKPSIRAENPNATQPTDSSSSSTNAPPSTIPKKPVYSMKKGQIVRVVKDKYLNSVNYLSVGHPPYYKGLDYIYEDRGEVLDLRMFETEEYALIAWVGVPTAPAWLPTEMLMKSEKLDYERM
ncbi:NAD(P)H-quinone oxidoreductase subunit O, chloroplastic [Mercurialis annua]|uniref:NAD(P)H-quinone oxidoreductase subunit O, chloroplastic n=1 Tax=Mercurialis annua TaxID=3986 RepID=UPI002160C8B5|nr:NAD(P)H-quinone oxidoreductase subunit O, chloroplastic [Mercurialis annua]